MGSTDYSKYKDRLPQDTIFAIQKILNEAGLFRNIHERKHQKILGKGGAIARTPS